MSVTHIPRKQNPVADFESRRNQREAEWWLDKAALQNALSRLNFQPDIDLFASCINYRPDPEAFTIDAFPYNGLRCIFSHFHLSV